MATQKIGMIKTFTSGSSNFEFHVEQDITNTILFYYKVLVKQTVNFSDEEVSEIGLDSNTTTMKWRFNVPNEVAPTEFSAINFCGNKLIKDWVNIK